MFLFIIHIKIHLYTSRKYFIFFPSCKMHKRLCTNHITVGVSHVLKSQVIITKRRRPLLTKQGLPRQGRSAQAPGQSIMQFMQYVYALYLAVVSPYTVLVTLVSTAEALVDTLVPRTTGGARRALGIEGACMHHEHFFKTPLPNLCFM